MRHLAARITALLLVAASVGLLVSSPATAQDAAGPAATATSDPLLPKHINSKTQLAIKRGLDYLAETQSSRGNWQSTRDTQSYPVSMTAMAGMAFLAHGNTTSRGPYARTVSSIVDYLIEQQDAIGLIAGPGNERGRPMYGHGFSLLFLASAYGMETDVRVRERMSKVIKNAIKLTAQGQSPLGGWTYTPGSGDEGSVTITQMQALRAARNAGFSVPQSTIDRAIRYLEQCRTPEGGIRYSFNSGPQTRLPISAAAIACLYSAGEYESPLADACLQYVHGQFHARAGSFSKGGGHDYYAHYYAAQAFYQAGDEYFDDYFPKARDQLLGMQANNGSWNGDGVGEVYGTSIALVILQLPYKYLPIYQR